MNRKPSENLLLVAESMADPETWVRGFTASEGAGCFWWHTEKVGIRLGECGEMRRFFYDANGEYPSIYNDNHTHAEVLNAVYEAARLAKEEGQ